MCEQFTITRNPIPFQASKSKPEQKKTSATKKQAPKTHKKLHAEETEEEDEEK
jgi:hypothetical protein